MTDKPTDHPSFHGLMTLARREGVDIRPTLLRVLTDLYVQQPTHTADEERQYVELASRLITEVDDAARAAVRARLAIYPRAPIQLLKMLALDPINRLPQRQSPPTAPVQARPPALPRAVAPASVPDIAGEKPEAADEFRDLSEMFFAASPVQRVAILQKFEHLPIEPAFLSLRQRDGAIERVTRAAMTANRDALAMELADLLSLPHGIARQVADDRSGEALLCAARALGMPAAQLQRLLLFVNEEIGSSVERVFRLSRLYDALSETTALKAIAVWRGKQPAVAPQQVPQQSPRPRHAAQLYDDERGRARPSAPAARPDRVQENTAKTIAARFGRNGNRRDRPA